MRDFGRRFGWRVITCIMHYFFLVGDGHSCEEGRVELRDEGGRKKYDLAKGPTMQCWKEVHAKR